MFPFRGASTRQGCSESQGAPNAHDPIALCCSRPKRHVQQAEWQGRCMSSGAGFTLRSERAGTTMATHSQIPRPLTAAFAQQGCTSTANVSFLWRIDQAGPFRKQGAPNAHNPTALCCSRPNQHVQQAEWQGRCMSSGARFTPKPSKHSDCAELRISGWVGGWVACPN